MKATIRLDIDHQLGEIDRRIFSGFMEHLGRCVYEGIYDPGSPLSDSNGFRKDVLQALRRLQIPCMRYPGGNFVSSYDWRDGIGPQGGRPSRLDQAWKSTDPNTFGIDEFIRWCRKAGTEPLVAVNQGTLGPREASDLVEYCNVSNGTYWSDLRRSNGSEEPHGVKLWCLGNQMDGPWQAGHGPAGDYAKRAQQTAHLMRRIDPSIELVLAGSSGRQMDTYLDWDREVLEYCWEDVDYISAHQYSRKFEEDSAWFLAEGVEIDRILEDYTGLLAYIRGVKKSKKQVYVAFDEWNVWYKNVERDGNWNFAPHLLEEIYNLEDALICAQYLSAFIRHSEVVKIACLAQVVNAIAPIQTRKDGLLLQTTYHTFRLYSENARWMALSPVVEGPTYDAGGRGEVPVLDVSASFDLDSSMVSLFIVNRSLDDDLEIEVTSADADIKRIVGVEVLTGDDPTIHNTWDSPDLIAPVAGSAAMEDGKIRLEVPSIGLVVMRILLERR